MIDQEGMPSNVRSDGLVDNVKFGGSVLLVRTLADSVNLVVNRCSVVVTVLTSTGNSPLDVRRMPCTDTGDLSETLVCLSRELLGAPISMLHQRNRDPW